MPLVPAISYCVCAAMYPFGRPPVMLEYRRVAVTLCSSIVRESRPHAPFSSSMVLRLTSPSHVYSSKFWTTTLGARQDILPPARRVSTAPALRCPIRLRYSRRPPPLPTNPYFLRRRKCAHAALSAVGSRNRLFSPLARLGYLSSTWPGQQGERDPKWPGYLRKRPEDNCHGGVSPYHR